MKIIKERTWNSDQSWHYEKIVVHPDGFRFRVQIKRNAYDTQSYARVSTWTTEEGWEVVTTDPIEVCACAGINYVMKNVRNADFKADAERLLDVAQEVVA